MWNIARMPNISASDSIGMKVPKKMNLPASRRSPAMNCGPTFMPIENMNRLKNTVLANSATAYLMP